MKIEASLTEKFPGLETVDLDLRGLIIGKTSDELAKFKKEKLEEIRRKYGSLEQLKNVPVFRAYRDFYWAVGIDPTKTRPAGEALARRILAGKDLPEINTFVDSYNLASAESGIAIGAFDLSHMNENALLMRLAKPGEKFLGIGMPEPIDLSGIEVVIEDESSKNLIAVYPYRDSDESKVTESTRDVLLMMCGVPGISKDLLELAKRLAEEYAERFCR